MRTTNIKGYKLKDELYRKPAKKITGMNQFFDEVETSVENFCFAEHSHAAQKIKQFEVMHWFYPVYEDDNSDEKSIQNLSTDDLIELQIEISNELRNRL